VHIPTSTTACEQCHSTTVFTAFSGTTMTSAKHTSMFTVIGSTCDACHNKVTPALSFYGVSNLQTRPSDHNSGSKATNDCSGCHNTNSWGGGAAKRTAVAQSPARSTIAAVVAAPPLRSDAAVLPSTSIAVPLSHAGVTSNCVSCHNGALAAGKGSSHLLSNDRCENCHTSNAWLPARFDHAGIAANCASCHNGALAPGRPIQHIATTLDCGACHQTLNWQSASFSHDAISGICQSCHNGITATAKQPRHVNTIADCGSCHSTLNWTVTATPPRLRPLIRSSPGATSGSSK